MRARRLLTIFAASLLAVRRRRDPARHTRPPLELAALDLPKELALEVPVIVHVSPSGARAASAGVWIAEAGDVLAPSPVSNMGSSTPIDSGGSNVGSGPSVEPERRQAA